MFQVEQVYTSAIRGLNVPSRTIVIRGLNVVSRASFTSATRCLYVLSRTIKALYM